MMVFGMHHQLGGSTEDNMNKMSVIGHISLYYKCSCDWVGERYCGLTINGITTDGRSTS